MMAQIGSMTLLPGFAAPCEYRGGFVSIGNFDGVHRGHQVILKQLVACARRRNVPAVVVTFDPHPSALLAPDRIPPRLLTLARKAELLGDFGINTVIALPPSKMLLGMSPTEFFESMIVQELQATGLIEGPNFCFGRNREGTVDILRELGIANNVDIEIVTPQLAGAELVSSTTIRQAIRAGHVERAQDLLGRPHRLTGQVISGAGRGRQLGFPTANLDKIAELLPADGVYGGLAHVGKEAYRAAIHLGPNPTFTEHTSKLEVHLLDFSGDLYGQAMSVDLTQKLRDLQTFASPHELKAQIERDLAQIK